LATLNELNIDKNRKNVDKVKNFKLGGHLGWKSGSPDTILEGAIQGSFHKSLVAIGPVVSEEKIFM
jgi:hypothetical protein